MVDHHGGGRAVHRGDRNPRCRRRGPFPAVGPLGRGDVSASHDPALERLVQNGFPSPGSALWLRTTYARKATPRGLLAAAVGARGGTHGSCVVFEDTIGRRSKPGSRRDASSSRSGTCRARRDHRAHRGLSRRSSSAPADDGELYSTRLSTSRACPCGLGARALGRCPSAPAAWRRRWRAGGPSRCLVRRE